MRSIRRLLALVCILHLCIPYAVAQDSAVTFDGEEFTKKFIGKPRNADKLTEYVRATESFENWTKLIGFRYQQLPGIQNDPKKAANGMGQVLKARNPNTPVRVIENDPVSEALIDFVMLNPDGETMEFNIWRFAKSTDGQGVISLQVAYRFTEVSSEGTDKFMKLRASWTKEAMAYDMNRVRTELGQ